MVKIKKKGTSGQVKNFITRTQAVRKLQVSLQDFRRLCILKGIYPREPRNKRKASKRSTPSTTFYYTKDIQYLLHEPILNSFRARKALSKKIGRLLGRGEVADAARLERTQTPRVKLDHIIKERYPTFVDALRDLDDALSLLFLFANLPSTDIVPAKIIAQCKRLTNEFEHYLIVSHTLHKSFISIKGIYYQATIQGQDILWLVPHKFVQLITGDVDFRIMGTFLEFYRTLMGFVNFRLYTSIGLVYPPKFEESMDEHGAELGAFRIESRSLEANQKQLENGDTTSSPNNASTKTSATAQAAADELAAQTTPAPETTEDEPLQPTEPTVSTALDTFNPPSDPTADTLTQPSSSTKAASLFRPFFFFLSRETPRHPLELLLRSHGCTRLAWDEVLGSGALTHDESDPRITHQVVDRPPFYPPDTNDSEAPAPRANLRAPGRIYIQPQWVWDSVNAGALQPTQLYAPGAELPPHLSPFVKPRDGAYDPTKSLAELEGDEDGVAAIEDGDAGSEDIEDDAVEDDVADELDEEEDEEESDAIVTTPPGSITNDSSPIKALADLDAGVPAASSDSSDVQVEVDNNDNNEEDDDEASFASFSSTSSPTTKTNPAPHLPKQQSHASTLLAEIHGARPSSLPTNPTSTSAQKRKQQAAEEHLERQLMMMPRRKRKLYERMKHGRDAREEEGRVLVGKRRRLEGEKQVGR